MLVVEQGLADKIDGGVVLPPGEAEVALRACAVQAVEVMSAAQDGEVTAAEIDFFLWGQLGKTGEYRRQARHATQDTIFY